MNLFEFMFAKLKLNLNFFSFLRFLDVLDFLNESIEEHLLGFYSQENGCPSWFANFHQNYCSIFRAPYCSLSLKFHVRWLVTTKIRVLVNFGFLPKKQHCLWFVLQSVHYLLYYLGFLYFTCLFLALIKKLLTFLFSVIFASLFVNVPPHLLQSLDCPLQKHGEVKFINQRYLSEKFHYH